MRRFLHAAGLFATVAVAQAQTLTLDQGVASELLRGALAPQAQGLLQGSPDLQRVYVEGVLEQSLAQEAARRGLDERHDVQRALMQARYQILLQALRDDVSRGVPQPKDSELEAAYKKDREKIAAPEALKLDVFAVDGAATDAAAALQMMVAAQKIDAEKLKALGARQLADAASGRWLAEPDLLPELWRGGREMRQGGLELFRAQGAYWLVRRVDYRMRTPLSFEQAREALRQTVLAQKQQEAWNQFLADRRKALGLP
jgi:hypothetical protein